MSDCTYSTAAFHLIYLRNGEMLLSKKHYNHWREIQDEYENYLTDLYFSDCDAIIQFFQDDFREEEKYPFSKSEILRFAESKNLVLST